MARFFVPFLLLAAAGQAQFVGSRVCGGCHSAQYQTVQVGTRAGAGGGSRVESGLLGFRRRCKGNYLFQPVDEDWYVEHGLSYYPARKMMAPMPGHDGGQDT